MPYKKNRKKTCEKIIIVILLQFAGLKKKLRNKLKLKVKFYEHVKQFQNFRIRELRVLRKLKNSNLKRRRIFYLRFDLTIIGKKLSRSFFTS